MEEFRALASHISAASFFILSASNIEIYALIRRQQILQKKNGRRTTAARSNHYLTIQPNAAYCRLKRKNTVGFAGLMVTFTGLVLPPG